MIYNSGTRSRLFGQARKLNSQLGGIFQNLS
jgi:hypothetical protein